MYFSFVNEEELCIRHMPLTLLKGLVVRFLLQSNVLGLISELRG